MKKVILKSLFILFFLIPIILSSQIRYGIKGTVHRTSVSEVHWNSKTRTAGAIGGFLQIPLGYDNQFFFQPELEYSMQGELDNKTKYFQNYLNVPILFRAYFSEDDSEFFLDLGPHIAFLVSEKSKEDDKKYYSKPESIDISIGAGVGYSINRKFDLSVRYNYGLTDVYKGVKGPNRTSRLGVTLAYTLN